jgi:hypothetical protein
VSWRAAPSGLIKLEAARRTARRMEGANAASTRAAPSLLKATWGTSDELTALYTRGTVWSTAEESASSTRAASSHLLEATRGIASHTAGANVVKRRARLKSARGDTGHCIAYGGGRRCQHKGGPKAAQSGGTQHCIAHGGGRRCQQEGCSKPAVRAPGSVNCRLCPPSARQFARRCSVAWAQAPSATGGMEELVARTTGGGRSVRGLPQAKQPQ